MKSLKIMPIPNEPALLIKDKKILVISDLHIGIETELKRYGINTPSQIKILIDNIINLCKNYNPNIIILLGDIKHNIPTFSYQEKKDVKELLNKIKYFGELHIIPGNHDGNIKKISTKDIIIHSSNGFVVEKIGFTHGHRWPSENIMKCEQLVIGHTHPTIMLTDRLGYKSIENCWIKGKFLRNKLKEKYPDSNSLKFIVMPAFNPLCGGIAVNEYGVVGPLGKIMDIKKSEIYLLDGTFLGFVRNIK